MLQDHRPQPGGVPEEFPGRIAAAQGERLRAFCAACKLFLPFARLTPADGTTLPRAPVRPKLRLDRSA
ncbi:hypothetical protein JCM30394_07300 [Deferrisoma palaeochoriense]